ncbi:bomanin Bicipital 1-like [Drosophila nasuta]|uniref:bomanin Bicipital 1-like n=1 Tax=Drosophila nasuta TaxID=42062 RepID=UPI00295E2D0D|nr:bomanin Bicipital 1-like [Drosophila nasuta]
MQRLVLLTVLVLAVLAANANAGKVTIRGQCVDCNRPEEESTTHKSSGSQDHAAHSPGQSKTSAAPAQASNSDWSQQLSNRFKRQWGGQQVIRFDGDDGGFSGGRSVTTIDGRGYPGTVVRNNDCVGCNIRG